MKIRTRVAAVAALAVGLVGLTAVAAEAHDATPVGTADASCPSVSTWGAHGTALLQDVPSSDNARTTVTLSTSAGTITQDPSKTATPGNNTTYHWTVTGISKSVSSVKISADTYWPGGHNGPNSATIARPANLTCTVADASASVTVTPPTCQADGTASYAVNHAHLDGTFSTAVGSHTQDFGADSGHTFADGSATESIAYTVEAKDVSQHCFVQPPDEHQYKHHSTVPNCKHQVIVTTNRERDRSYVWNGTKYVPGPWTAWYVTSVSKHHVTLTKRCERFAHTGVKITDKCNCFMDKVLFLHGPNVRVVKSHPTRLTWLFKVTGKKVAGHQYLVPRKIGGSHGWAITQTYKVTTTNVPCPCHLTHTCTHNGPPHHHCPTDLADKTCKLD